MLSSVIVVVCIFLGAAIAAPNCSKMPDKDDVLECCKIPTPMRDLATKCTDKFPLDGKMYFCHGECLLNGSGFSVNGKIQPDKVPAAIDFFLKDFPDFIPLAKAAFPRCEEFAKKELPKLMEKKLEVGDDCNPISSLVASCFFVETVVNCPASLWQNNKDCNEAKEYLKHCSLNQH